MGTRVAKGQRRDIRESIFGEYSLGVSTNRDRFVYDFNNKTLEKTVESLSQKYSAEMDRWERAGKPEDIDKFVDNSAIKWSHFLKRKLTQLQPGMATTSAVVPCEYRPFTMKFLHFDYTFVDAPGLQRRFFPKSDCENRAIFVSDKGYRAPFSTLAVSRVADLHLCASEDGFQCFPFYTYSEDGTNRRENITDWALEQFRSHYGDPSITKWDIFHYVYAVLHHPEYRQRYAANLRRELPRIPFVGTSGAKARIKDDANAAINGRSSTNTQSSDEKFSAQISAAKVGGENASTRSSQNDTGPRSFDSGNRFASESVSSAQDDTGGVVNGSAQDDRNVVSGAAAQDDRTGEMRDVDVFRAFVKAGQRLAEIHVHYEQQPEYPLTKTERAGEKLDYRVEKMKLNKDKTTLTYNRFLTLSGIPKETYDYRLGNRCALEWIVDQYQISTDKRSGITNDPNRAADPNYILRLIGQVITVSLETVKIVASFPALGLPDVAVPAGTTE